MFIGEIVGGNAWLVHTIRHLRRRCAHTIATQQEMEISLRLFPFPTVLSIIYRLRRISRFPVSCFRIHPGMPVTIRHLRRRCLYTINTQQGLTSYAFGLHLLIPTVLSTIYRLRRIPGFRFPIPGSRFLISGSRFPIFRALADATAGEFAIQ